MEFNRELIKKYDNPGPRYTSYPTAPHFSDEFRYDEYIRAIQVSNKEEKDLSLYFHMPFCDTLCYFCGCNMIITHRGGRVTKYIDYLKKEIDLLSAMTNNKRKVSQLHWGGGTPTHFSPDEIREVKEYINSKFTFKDTCEQSCEIDPRELTKDHLVALRETGFNRVSLGVQDIDEKVQKAVNRIQPESMTREVIQWVRQLGFHSLNLDLMYGLPFQSAEQFEKTVEVVLDMSPDRIALFNFAYVPWVKGHMKLIDEETLPNSEEKLDILKMTLEKLIDAGYVSIGMDHFAKPEDELTIALNDRKLYRNFQGYSTNAEAELFAFGITGISQHGNIYAQNVRTEKEYFSCLDKGILPLFKGYTLTKDDRIRKDVIMTLMCNFMLDIEDVEQRLNISFKEYFAYGLKKIEPMVEDGLVIVSDKTIEVSAVGKMLIRNIAMCFDGFLERKEDKNRYSKTL